MTFRLNYCRKQDRNCSAGMSRRSARSCLFMTNCGSSPVRFSYHMIACLFVITINAADNANAICALEHFNEFRNAPKMTTGFAELDSLIDGVQEGQFYLFYSRNRAVLEG